MDSMKLGMELANMSTKLAGVKPPVARISEVPQPITPVDGNGGGGGAFDPETAPMDDYYRNFEARRAARNA